MKKQAATEYTVRIVLSDGQEETLKVQATSVADAHVRGQVLTTLRPQGQGMTVYVNSKESRIGR